MKKLKIIIIITINIITIKFDIQKNPKPTLLFWREPNTKIKEVIEERDKKRKKKKEWFIKTKPKAIHHHALLVRKLLLRL